MPEPVTVLLNNRALQVPPGTMVAVALALAGTRAGRRSVTGEPRAPLCGMGVCFECRVTINGQPHQRSCVTLCEEGMEICTDELPAR